MQRANSVTVVGVGFLGDRLSGLLSSDGIGLIELYGESLIDCVAQAT